MGTNGGLDRRSRQTRKLVTAALLIAVGLVIPQLFHGVPQGGNIFLPMHIPVLLAGFLLGPAYGLWIGAALPVVSSLVMNMPPPARLPFMVGELLTYGLVSGLLYRRLREVKGGIPITLVAAMVAGRAMYALLLAGATYLLHVECGGVIAAVTATVTGVPGIIIQLVLAPTLVYALKRGGILDELE